MGYGLVPRSEQSAFVRSVMRHHDAARMAMRGTSMLPLLREPMVLTIAPLRGRAPIGAILVFEGPRQLVAHRVVGYAGDDHVTAGDNTAGVRERVAPAEIIGVVREVWSENGPQARRLDGRLFRARGLAHALFHRLRSLDPKRHPQAFAALVRAAGAALRGERADVAAAARRIDAPAFARAAGRHRCAALISAALEANAAADPDLDGLRALLRKRRWITALRVAHYRKDVRAVTGLLRAAGLDPILLKGAARAWTSQAQLALHDSADIDVLLPHAALPQAAAALAAAGYAMGSDAHANDRFNRRHHHLAPFYKPGAAPVELHHELAPPGSMTLRLDYDTLLAHSTVVCSGAIAARVLDSIASALHLALHARDFSALRDLVLLAAQLRELDATRLECLRAFAGRERMDRIRLQAALHTAAQLAGVAWPVDAATRRYLGWVSVREDLPPGWGGRVQLLEALAASGGRLNAAWREILLPSALMDPANRRLAPALRAARTAGRIAVGAVLAPYVLRMRRR